MQKYINFFLKLSYAHGQNFVLKLTNVHVQNFVLK